MINLTIILFNWGKWENVNDKEGYDTEVNEKEGYESL